MAADEKYREAVSLAAATFAVEPDAVLRSDGVLNWMQPTAVQMARRAAVYLSVVALNNSMRSVARAARLSPEGVRKALAGIEDLRDDPEFERTISQLEAEIAA